MKKAVGLQPIGVVMEYLGVARGEWQRLSEEDGLPVILVPGKKRPSPKIALRQLWKWLRESSKYGARLSWTDFLEDWGAFNAKKGGER